jgi:WD40 repeat protein
LLASAPEGRAPTVRLWALATGACVGVLCAHAHDLCALALAPDGSLLAACGSDAGQRQVVSVWDTAAVRAGGAARLLCAKRTDHHVAQLKFAGGPADDELGLAEERQRLVSCGAENICFWRLKGGTLRQAVADLRGHAAASGGAAEAFVAIATDAVSRAALVSAASRRAFVSTASGKVFQLRVETRALEYVFQLHDCMIGALHLTEAFCVTGAVDGTLRVWPLDFAEFLLEASHDGPLTCIESSADGLTVLIAVDRVNSLGLMDLSTHKHATLVRAHTAGVRCCAADPRRAQFVTASADLSVRVWDCESGRQLCEFAAADDAPTTLRYHPTAHALAVGYASGAVRLFDIESTRLLHECKLHAAPVLALAFDGRGALLFSAAADGALVAREAAKAYLPFQVYAAPRPGGAVGLALVAAAAAGRAAAGGGGGGVGSGASDGVVESGDQGRPHEGSRQVAVAVCGHQRPAVPPRQPKRGQQQRRPQRRAPQSPRRNPGLPLRRRPSTQPPPPPRLLLRRRLAPVVVRCRQRCERARPQPRHTGRQSHQATSEARNRSRPPVCSAAALSAVAVAAAVKGVVKGVDGRPHPGGATRREVEDAEVEGVQELERVKAQRAERLERQPGGRELGRRPKQPRVRAHPVRSCRWVRTRRRVHVERELHGGCRRQSMGPVPTDRAEPGASQGRGRGLSSGWPLDGVQSVE